MNYEHYPMAMYKNGDRNAASVTVGNAEEEMAARAEGFKMIDPEADAKAHAMLPAPTEPKKKAK